MQPRNLSISVTVELDAKKYSFNTEATEVNCIMLPIDEAQENSDPFRDFSEACECDNLSEAKKLYNHDVPLKLVQKEFIKACFNSHLDLAGWLYSLGCTATYHLFIALCMRDRLHEAMWLHITCNILVSGTFINSFFVDACHAGKLDAAIWARDWSTNQKYFAHVNEKYNISKKSISDAYKGACEVNNLEVVKWLYGVEQAIVSSQGDSEFEDACACDYLELAQFLHSVKLSDDLNSVMVQACNCGEFGIVKWLLTIGATFA